MYNNNIWLLSTLYVIPAKLDICTHGGISSDKNEQLFCTSHVEIYSRNESRTSIIVEVTNTQPNFFHFLCDVPTYDR